MTTSDAAHTHSPERDADIARDFLLSSSYRKEEQDGEKWVRFRRGEFSVAALPTIDRPYVRDTGRRRRFTRTMVSGLRPPIPEGDAVSVLAAICAGAVLTSECLGHFLRLLASPIRWEPLNGGGLHQATASPMALFGIDLYFTSAFRGTHAVWRWNRLHGFLERLNANPTLAANMCDGGTLLLIVGDLARYGATYGEFSPCLAALEGGAVLHQARALARAMGVSGQPTDLAPSRIRTLLSLGHWSEVPLGALRIGSGGEWFEGCTEIREEILSLRDSPVGIERYDRVRRLVQAAETECEGEDQPKARLVENPDTGPDPSTLRWIFDAARTRSAGYGPAFFSHGRIGAPEISRLCENIRRLLLPCDRLAPFFPVIYLALPNSSAGSGHLHRVDLEKGLVPVSGTYHRTDDPMAPDTSAFTFILSCREVLNARLSASGLLAAHLRAGEVGHAIGLAAASVGMTARPLRSYDQATAERGLPLDEWVVFQIACGFENRPSPKLTIR